MTSILAIDPGCTDSAYITIDQATRRPLDFGKIPNTQLLDQLCDRDLGEQVDHLAIEMIASYGMPVGREVFETCVWIGRFDMAAYSVTTSLVYRQPVKTHHCHSSKASDANVAQALKDRFAYGISNHGKGTKAQPGWFYGFKADIWQAYALAVYVADTFPVSSPVAASTPAAGEAPISDAPDPSGEGSQGRPTPTPTVQEVLL